MSLEDTDELQSDSSYVSSDEFGLHGSYESDFSNESASSDYEWYQLPDSDDLFSRVRESGLFEHGDDSSIASLEFSSDEEISERPVEEEGISLQQLVPLSTPSGQCKGALYNRVMWRLEHLHDNGKWKEFDDFSSRMLAHCLQCGLKDLECVTRIEMGVAAYFKNKLNMAKSLFKQALKLAEKTGNPTMLEGRAKYWLAHLYRQEKKMGKAESALDIAQQILSTHTSFEDNAEVNYGYGNFLLTMITLTSHPSIQICKRAKEYFQREFQIVKDCKDQRIKNKKMRYALLRIAQLLLDCGNRSARDRLVPYSDIKEAQECLDMIEREVWDDIPFGTEIEFWFARSDQFYRQGNYSRALDFAVKAHSMTTERKFEKHAIKAEERILHLWQFNIASDRITEIPNEMFIQRILQTTDQSISSSPVVTDDGQ